MVDALDRTVLPELNGGARARAGECATILRRVAQSLLDEGEAGTAAIRARLAQYVQPLAPGLWREVAELEGAELDRAESLAVASGSTANAATSSSRSFSPELLERYLRQHPLGGEAVRVTSSRLLSGGRSKQTTLVQLEGARDLPSTVVVRQDWSSAVTGTSVVSEYALLKGVFEAGLRVPQPLLLEKSSEPLGGPFLVVTQMPGAIQGDIFAPPRSEALALQLAEQLARLHRLPTEAFAALGVPTEAYTTEQLRVGLQGFRALNGKLGFPSRTIDIAMDWLERRIDRVSGPKAVLHNDLGFHNFLVDGERLSAILDWELAHIGNPAADLGYARDWVSQMIPWSRFMQAYREAGGPEVDAATLDFYTLWCGVRLYCLLLQARAGVAMGMVQDTEITYAVAHFLPKLLHRISRELRAVLATGA
ncbi:MAG: phosphotransferase family protein [Sinobacteraceae bacterium]|nr:phosphotransferase family protein [Nevskiaceae bacterium]